MKRGDLVRVSYRGGVAEWDGPYHGVIFETPDMGPECIWKMWCIERGQPHILSPHMDKIEVISKADISLTMTSLT